MKSLWTAKKISVLYGLLFAVFVTLIVISFSYLIFLVPSLPYSYIPGETRMEKKTKHGLV